MALFNLKKNDRLTVKVLEKRQFSNKAIYEVEYNGQKLQVPMFEYQKEQPLPETIECVVQSVSDNSLYLQQNISALLRENYKIGQIYEYQVAQDYTTTSNPHYKLTDGTGFFFKLSAGPKLKLTKNRRIRCKIRKIKGVEVDLEFVGVVHELNESLSVGTLVEKIGPDASRLLAYFRNRTDMAEIYDLYEAGSPEWLPKAIGFAADEFAAAPLADVDRWRLSLVESLARIVVWFLEDSDYFDSFQEAERYQWQSGFGRVLRRITALASAYEVILSGCQQSYIDRIIRKFKVSGYLIDAGHKLLTLRMVLAIDPSSLNNVIDEMLSVVVDRRADCLREATFRRSFIELFQLYVDNNSHELDEMDEAETQEAKSALHTMLRVLAVQLLLACDLSDDADSFDIDFELNRSRLYRYLTLQNNSGDEEIINKALMALLASETWRTEYTWNDVSDVIKLATRLRQPSGVSTLPAIFETPMVTLKVSEDLIEVDANQGEADCTVFPTDDLTLWHGMKVNLSSPMPANLRQPRTIAQYRHFWTELNRRLSDHSENADEIVRNVRTLPQRGQDVEIEIYAIDPDNRERFLCRVVEEGLCGEGFIEKREISSSNQEIPLDVFLDRDGNPLVFRAVVLSVRGDHSLEFSLTETLNDYFRSIISYDTIYDCVILRKIADTCTVLARQGFTLNVTLDSDHDYLEAGDIIRVTNININGNWREGEYFGEASGRIDFQAVIRALMADFALRDYPDDDFPDDSDYAEEGSTIQEANRMEAAAVTEVIRIIESIASKVRDNRVAYNYYAYAGMLARMIEDVTLQAYYDKRCRLLEAFDDFSTNGRVDLEQLNELMSDLVKGNNSLSNDGEKLRILSVLDHSENNAYLWNLFSSNANESLQELARLVLAYNMLDGFKMREQRLEIRNKLYARLRVDIEKQPAVIAGGRENLTTEFKTSIAYPANSMRLDVAAQTQVILKVITAFLNTSGGTLYIGVSDEGYVRGLETDLAYFRSKDSFDRHVHDNIRKHMTYIPNIHNFIETGWIENSGKDVYVVKVQPVYEPIELDGVYYYRDGSSCVMVRQEQEERFIKSRSALAPSEDAVRRQSHRPSQESGSSAMTTVFPVVAPAAEEDGRIATSEFRNNVLHDGYPGYDIVSDYIYFFSDGTFEIVQIDRWQEESSALALGIHPSEREGNLVVVSADGYACRHSVEAMAESEHRLSPKLRPCFISPMADDDKLVMIYRDSDGIPFKRIFAASDIRTVRPGERGEMLNREIDSVIFCEIVRPDAQQSFKSIVRKQRIGREQSAIEREQTMILERLRKS